MTIKGVLFDFSGTLFRIEPAEAWLRAVLTELEDRERRAPFPAPLSRVPPLC
ncbi:hydrolase, partial [Streptomyces sp. NPDC005918]